jgi:hypothetical protein
LNTFAPLASDIVQEYFAFVLLPVGQIGGQSGQMLFHTNSLTLVVLERVPNRSTSAAALIAVVLALSGPGVVGLRSAVTRLLGVLAVPTSREAGTTLRKG